MKIETTIPRPGVVRQTLSSDDFPSHGDMLATHTARIIDVAALQFEDAIRSQLIELGWTPPPETKGE